MLRVTAEGALVTSDWSFRELATYSGQVNDPRDANPSLCKRSRIIILFFNLYIIKV